VTEGSRLDGAQVVAEVEKWVGRLLALPSEHAAVVIALWAAHTWAPQVWYVTPRLVLDSAEPGSGKTRVLELLNLLVLNPEMTINSTPAAIFRMLADQPYSLLFDEVDAIFNPKNGGNYEDLRALINAGYKRGATIARCVGDAKSMKVQRFSVFAPVALAGIAGKMPATITTRSITIHMRRRGPGEKVDPFRERDAETEAKPYRDALAEWVRSVAGALSTARPTMPPGVVDRPSEVWEALLAIADTAGGDWPEKARAACVHFVLKANPEKMTTGVRLLHDIRRILGADKSDGPQRIPTADLLAKLHAIDEAPWGDLYGKPLTTRRLSQELARYDVAPIQWREGTVTERGYATYGTETPVAQAGLADAWARYLESGGTPATPGTSKVNPVPGPNPVPDQRGTADQPGTP
jgi:hypothetical protein